MHRIAGVAWSIAALAIVGCGSAPPVVATNAPPAAVDAYPMTLPIVDDAELARRTSELVAKTPGWTITLDVLGALAHATCDVCAKTKPMDRTTTADDREKIEAFVSVHRHLLGLDSPGVVAKADKLGGVFFQQVTPWGIMGSVRGYRIAGAVIVFGKMWPAVPAPGAWLADADLEAKLRALDASTDLSMEHRYQRIERVDHGPIEFHEAACLVTPVDAIPIFHFPSGETPIRPCVDARTGEDLTPLGVSWKVQTINGTDTSRSIERHAAPKPSRSESPPCTCIKGEPLCSCL